MLPNRQGGFSTELSFEFEFDGRTIEAPLLTPNLDGGELMMLLSGMRPTNSIYRKAQEHAMRRILGGLDPFAQPGELRWPMPR